jgi:hypothetical protein
MICKSNVTRRAAVLFLAGMALTVAFPVTRADALEGCSGEAYRAFDFWLGRWDVHLEDGRLAGTNRIESAAQGCLIREAWTGQGGGQGFSMSFYDPAADRWRQVWVSGGSLIEIAGGLDDQSMVLSGEITDRRTGDVRPFRGRWTPLPDGRVRQFFEEYQDDKGWQSWFDGIYTKVLE